MEQTEEENRRAQQERIDQEERKTAYFLQTLRQEPQVMRLRVV